MTRQRRVSRSLERAAPAATDEPYNVAARALSGLGERVGQMADRAAAAEGAEAGARDGFDPEFRPKRENTIRGRSYDRAGLRAATIATEGAIRGELAGAFDEAGGDAQLFAQQAEDIRAKRIETLALSAPEIRPDLEASFERVKFGYDRELARIQKARDTEETQAELDSVLSRTEVDLGRMAYQLGLDDRADQVLTDELAQLQAQLLHYGPRGEFEFQGETYGADPDRLELVDLPFVQATMEKAADMVAGNRIKGAFSRLGGLPAQRAFLEEFRADYAAGDDVPALMTLDQFERLDREMETDIRQAEAAARAAEADIRRQISDVRSQLGAYRSFAGDGFLPPAAVIDGFRQQARTLGSADLLGEVANLERMTSVAGAAAKLSPIELSAEINRRRVAGADGVSPQEAAEINLLENVHSGMVTALGRDPLSFAIQAGVVPAIPLYEGDALELSVRGRSGAAKIIEQTYGVKGALFTADEARQFKQIEDAGGAELVTLATTIASEFGAEAPDALARISDQAGLLAHLGGLAHFGGSRDAIDAAARGQALLAQKEGVASGLGTDARDLAREMLSPVLAYDGRARRDVERTASAIYVGYQGLNADWDDELYQRALNESMGAVYLQGEQFGGIAQIGDGWWDGLETSRVILPSWVRAREATSIAKSLELDDYLESGQPFYSDGSDVELEALQGAYWSTVRPGVYNLSLKDPTSADPQFLSGGGADGLYELDLNRLRDRVSERMPEAVLP